MWGGGGEGNSFSVAVLSILVVGCGMMREGLGDVKTGSKRLRELHCCG